MTVTVYPSLIHIQDGGYSQKYIGYTKAQAIKKFKQYLKLQKK